jgi:alpha/beta superfamily hydrolase
MLKFTSVGDTVGADTPSVVAETYCFGSRITSAMPTKTEATDGAISHHLRRRTSERWNARPAREPAIVLTSRRDRPISPPMVVVSLSRCSIPPIICWMSKVCSPPATVARCRV